MFESDISRDGASKKVTRRVFFAGAAAVMASAAVLRWREVPGVEASTDVHGTPGEVSVVNFADDGTRLSTERVSKVIKTDGAWFQQLGANSFRIARQADTEMPGFGVNLNEHRPGVFRCLCCDTALFASKTKFDSGTGWPSFWVPIAKENVAELNDASLGMARTEVRCVRCEAHLGHVFDDGPDPTGLRYCLNSASLRFAKA